MRASLINAWKSKYNIRFSSIDIKVHLSRTVWWCTDAYNAKQKRKDRSRWCLLRPSQKLEDLQREFVWCVRKQADWEKLSFGGALAIWPTNDTFQYDHANTNRSSDRSGAPHAFTSMLFQRQLAIKNGLAVQLSFKRWSKKDSVQMDVNNSKHRLHQFVHESGDSWANKRYQGYARI